MSDPAQVLTADAEVAWLSICEHLKKQLTQQSFTTWFSPLEPISLKGNVLTVRVPRKIFCEWIEGYYSKQLRNAIHYALNKNIEVNYVVNSKDKKKKKELVKIKSNNENNSTNRKIKPFRSNLNPQYCFSNFIEGDCNKFARAAAIAIAQNPGNNSFNPLLIYGGSGLGKTHLIQAIGNSAVKHSKSLRVLYATSEQFTSDFVQAIKLNRTDTFNRLYRSVDILLIDDVQFFLAKEKTQEEFFHTFNVLHQSGKQLVFSSDRSPHEFNGFDVRLTTRLQWGLVSELQTPDYETRMAILKDHAEKAGISLPDDVANYLSVNIKDNIRTLQGSLTHILAQASFLGKPITIKLARKTYQKFSNRIQYHITIDQIQNAVADDYDIPCDLLRSKTRKKYVVEARHVAMYLSTELTKSTLKTIGLQFGGRDHATVIHARETVNEKIKNDIQINEIIERIQRKLELLNSSY